VGEITEAQDATGEGLGCYSRTPGLEVINAARPP
jgi:hypothetical protein